MSEVPRSTTTRSPSAPNGGRQRPREWEDSVRLSLRLLVLIDGVGPVGEDGVARRESSQQGMAEVLSATQGAVSKVVRRLVASGVIRQERRHVRGVNRRLRVYFLTPLGASVVREYFVRIGVPKPALSKPEAVSGRDPGGFSIAPTANGT